MDDPGQWDPFDISGAPLTPSLEQTLETAESHELKRRTLYRKPVAYPALVDERSLSPQNINPRARPTSTITEESGRDLELKYDSDYVFDGSRPKKPYVL